MTTETTMTLRERQAPLKKRYQEEPESAKLVMSAHSVTEGNNPTRVTIAVPNSNGELAISWDAGAHPMAGGDGEVACSGDLLLASLAACQEVTLRMVASAMGVELRNFDLRVEGDLDFRGTMGIDPESPVGFAAIRTIISFDADEAPERLERLVARAERYCVVGATLRDGTELTTSIEARSAIGAAGHE